MPLKPTKKNEAKLIAYLAAQGQPVRNDVPKMKAKKKC